MKSIANYIKEALKLGNKSRYKYHPETKEELQDLLNQLLEERGNEGDFNDIDTSKITDMSDLFYDLTDFNGNISQWDVSNVTNMSSMFYKCKSFNKDISKWDVSNVTNMYSMFRVCRSFNQDISGWNVSNVINNIDMFYACPLQEKYKPKFK